MNRHYELIKKTIEAVSGIDDIAVTKRTREQAELRWIYYALSRHYLGNKFVGLHCSKLIKRHHATVLHGLRQYDIMIETNQFESLDILKKCKKILSPFLGNINDDEIFISEAKITYLEKSLVAEHIILNELLTKRSKRIKVNYELIAS